MTQVLDDVKVVDADTHLTEVHDLWTSRAPAEYVDRVPRVVPIDGQPTWVVEGTPIRFAGGGGVVGRDGTKTPAAESLHVWTLDRVHVAAHDPVARLELMDESGIWAQVLYPNLIGIGGQDMSQAIDDPVVRRLCVEIYNDAMAEIQANSGNRLLPMPVLPAWDVDASVREARRVSGLGLRGVNMTSDTQDLGAPDLGDRAWDPLWEVCSELHLPVHFHIGASITTMSFYDRYPWPSHDEGTKLAIGGTLLFIGNARVVTNIILSGMLDRHPELKMVSVESGVGWIPFILETLDYELAENAPERFDSLQLKPSEYFKRQLYATFWFERSNGNLPALIAAVGEDNVLFETDFPHPTCLYPNPLGEVADKLALLRPEVQRKILSDNARQLYRLYP